MLSTLPPYLLYIIATVVAAVIIMYSVKKIIFITRKRKIYDIPDNIRKIHGEEIPSLGGIGVFTGYLATASFFATDGFKGWNYILISSLVLFFTGIYDDIANMRPSKKLLAQLIAAAITIYCADIRITSLYGFMGIGELSYWGSIALTTFCCTFFINVFNFIDGIDGLACMIAIVYALILGALFATVGHTGEACVSFCLAGATSGLLYYNYAPARIYMGDTGSMLTGFIVFILSLLLISATEHTVSPTLPVTPLQALFIVVAMLFLPVFDALRVFVLRAAKGISPLKADRRHLHYYLLDAGFTHAQAAWSLTMVNVVTIALALLLRNIAPLYLLLIIALPSIIMVVIAQRLRKNKV